MKKSIQFLHKASKTLQAHIDLKVLQAGEITLGWATRRRNYVHATYTVINSRGLLQLWRLANKMADLKKSSVNRENLILVATINNLYYLLMCGCGLL